MNLSNIQKITCIILRNLFGLDLFSHQSCATGTLLLQKKIYPRKSSLNLKQLIFFMLLKGVTTENISVFYNPYMFLFVFYIYCAYYCCSNVCLKFELCISMKRDKSSLRSSTCGATWASRPCSRTGTTRTSSSGC